MLIRFLIRMRPSKLHYLSPIKRRFLHIHYAVNTFVVFNLLQNRAIRFRHHLNRFVQVLHNWWCPVCSSRTKETCCTRLGENDMLLDAVLLVFDCRCLKWANTFHWSFLQSLCTDSWIGKKSDVNKCVTSWKVTTGWPVAMTQCHHDAMMVFCVPIDDYSLK